MSTCYGNFPGLRSNIGGYYLAAQFKNGTLADKFTDTKQAWSSFRFEDGRAIFSIAIRYDSNSSYFAYPLENMNSDIRRASAKNTTGAFSESERIAKAYAKVTHLEEYLFSHIEKYGFLKGKRAVYEFSGARKLEAVEGIHFWSLEPGAAVAIPSSNKVLSLLGRWDEKIKEVEDAASAFHRVANLFPSDTFSLELEPARSNVALLLAQSKEAAAVGVELDGISAATADMIELREDAFSTLEKKRQEILIQLTLVSKLRLQLDDTFSLPSSDSDALHCLTKASAEIMEIKSQA